MSKLTDPAAKTLIDKVLTRPDLFPEQFKSWLARFIRGNTIIEAPVTSSGGVEETGNNLMVLWEGQIGPSTPLGNVWIVPEVGGTVVSFVLNRQTFISFPSPSTTYVAETQYSTDGGSTWTTITSNTLTSANNENVVTPSKTVNSGDLVRLNWTTIGTNLGVWTVQLEGAVSGTLPSGTSIASTVEIQATDPNGSVVGVVTGQAYFRVPASLSGLSLSSIATAVTTASSSGGVSVQIHNVTQSADMLTTVCSIDATKTDSSTAATPAVISATHAGVTTADMLEVNVTAAGTGAKGLIVVMEFS